MNEWIKNGRQNKENRRLKDGWTHEIRNEWMMVGNNDWIEKEGKRKREMIWMTDGKCLNPGVSVIRLVWSSGWR